jgi:hypothetical protein
MAELPAMPALQHHPGHPPAAEKPSPPELLAESREQLASG